MRLVRLAGPLLFLAGVAALSVGFLQGQATLSLLIVFPVVTATGPWSILGIVLMVASFFLLFLTWSAPVAAPMATAPAPPSVGAGPPPTQQHRWGGVVFLGPIPVVFGSDPKVTRWMLVVGALLFVALVVLTVIALRGI